MKEKQYLGDSVYVRTDPIGNIILTTENGGPKPSNVIVLEPEVLEQLLNYIKPGG